MRERITIRSTAAPTLDRYKVKRSNNQTIAKYTSDTTVVDTSVMHDVVTPRFKELVAQGSIINNAMDREVVRDYRRVITMDVTDEHYHYYGNFYPEAQGNFTLLPYDSAYLPRLKDQAVTSAWARLSSSKASLIVTFAEGGKTINGLVDCFKRFNKITKSIRAVTIKFVSRRARKKAKVYLLKQTDFNELLDRWLEWRYGIRPIIGDINSIIDAINSEALVSGSRMTFRGYEPATWTAEDQVTSTFSSLIRYKLYRKTVVSGEVRAGVLSQVRQTPLPGAVYGLYDIPQAVWDLTPYSFVADWFFNIGDVIASWTPSAAFTALASWVTVRLLVTQTCVQGPETYRANKVSGSFSGGSYGKETEIYTRVPSPPRAVCPSFSVNLDTKKLIDIVALSRTLWRTIPHVRAY